MSYGGLQPLSVFKQEMLLVFLTCFAVCSATSALHLQDVLGFKPDGAALDDND